MLEQLLKESMTQAGFKIVDTKIYDGGDVEVFVELDELGNSEPLYFELKDNVVIWWDFRQCTRIGTPDQLVEKFTELFPLKGDDLDNWIQQNQMTPA